MRHEAALRDHEDLVGSMVPRVRDQHGALAPPPTEEPRRGKRPHQIRNKAVEGGGATQGSGEACSQTLVEKPLAQNCGHNR